MNQEKYDVGLKLRKEVLGEEHVGNVIRNSTYITKPLQDLVNEYCWGTIWTRPGLSRKTRSLLNLVILTSLGKPHELGIHVIGAVRNGCSKDEIIEALLQATVYCGVAAGAEAFAAVNEALSAYEKSNKR